MQERRLYRDRVQAEVGEDLRGRKRMRHVRLAAHAVLALVGVPGEPVRLADAGKVGLREVLLDGSLDAALGGIEGTRREWHRRRGTPAARPVGPGRFRGEWLDGHRHVSVA